MRPVADATPSVRRTASRSAGVSRPPDAAETTTSTLRAARANWSTRALLALSLKIIVPATNATASTIANPVGTRRRGRSPVRRTSGPQPLEPVGDAVRGGRPKVVDDA